MLLNNQRVNIPSPSRFSWDGCGCREQLLSRGLSPAGLEQQLLDGHKLEAARKIKGGSLDHKQERDEDEPKGGMSRREG